MVLAFTAHKTGNLINPPVTCICLSIGKNIVIPSAIWNSCHLSMSVIHQGQTRPDKPDLPLWQSNVLCSNMVSDGRCLPGFLQSFQYHFPQPPPGETGVPWSVQWMGKRLTGSPRTPDMLINSSVPNWQPVTSGDPQGEILDSTLLAAFIKDVEDRIKCTVMTFTNETKLKTLEGRATLQENLDRLKEWDKKSSGISSETRSCTWENIVQECSTGWDLPSWGVPLWKGNQRNCNNHPREVDSLALDTFEIQLYRVLSHLV